MLYIDSLILKVKMALLVQIRAQYEAKQPGRMATAHGDENGRQGGGNGRKMAVGLVRAAELGNGAQVVPQ
ncbi:MAG TPA: hypothetical protein VN924_07070, partial [Bryobacteraceae bacterium]|nr:hypothetical protein [Bryobacteraceae bacterium]